MPIDTTGYRDPLDLIVKRTPPDEDPADVMYLCGYMALVLFSHSVDADDRQDARRYYKLLERSGKILCLIFDFLKPPHYVEAMIEVRRGYAGIANNVDLQAYYGRKLDKLIAEGVFRDLETAIDSGLPRRLAVGT